VSVAVFHRIGAPDPGTFTNSMEQIRSWPGEKTFDGIYTSVWDHRYEIGQLDGDVWLFAAGDTIGKDGFITHHQLLTLAHEFGCKLGWHTWSHPDMRMLTDDQIWAELDCPDWMPRDAFAYPYGDFSPRAVELVKEAGYGKAYSTTQGNSDAFSIYRAYI
jgi:peptidoglycan/xylan/chitin deacetylase (PgdA/CDA1 family)